MSSPGWPPPNPSFDPQSYPPPQPTWPPPTAGPGPQPAWPQHNWQQNGWAPQPGLPYGTPFQSKRRKWPFIVVCAVIVLVVGAIAAGVTVYQNQSAGAKRVATTYLSALGRGDFDTAYDQWCGTDQANFPPAAFRAQREYRIGEVDTVRGVTITTATSGTSADVEFWNQTQDVMQSLALSRVQGSWKICPQGERLTSDMENCSCMTPSQHLEADIAFRLNRMRSHYPLNAVQCPALTALVDGQPVVCRGTTRDGRSWDFQATVSNDATDIDVKQLSTTT